VRKAFFWPSNRPRRSPAKRVGASEQDRLRSYFTPAFRAKTSSVLTAQVPEAQHLGRRLCFRTLRDRHAPFIELEIGQRDAHGGRQHGRVGALALDADVAAALEEHPINLRTLMRGPEASVGGRSA